MPIATFLESYDFSGKAIVPFCTHEGSGLGGVADIKRLAPGATVAEGFGVRGSDVETCDRALGEWLDKVARR